MHWHITCQTGRGSNKIVLSKPLVSPINCIYLNVYLNTLCLYGISICSNCIVSFVVPSAATWRNRMWILCYEIYG